MPLNHQLQSLGATFCRTVKTAASYQLFAMAGQSIPKPGLLRVAAGEGAAIEVEVWSLSAEAFGKFVAAIPAPLGIGSVELADGTTPKGFLAETAGLKFATDISHLRGWRAYTKSLRG